jgi:RNA polymerase sigma-70 factor (ECF subfamily)
MPDHSEQLYDDDDFALLRRFVQELKEIDKALIILHLDGLSSKAVAEVVGTSQTNVTTKISRIKKKLKRKFDEHNKKNHG